MLCFRASTSLSDYLLQIISGVAAVEDSEAEGHDAIDGADNKNSPDEDFLPPLDNEAHEEDAQRYLDYRYCNDVEGLPYKHPLIDVS